MKGLYKTTINIAGVLLLNLITIVGLAQTRYLIGSVQDEFGYPLQAVNVAVANSTESTITDEWGAFSISCDENSGNLEFSFDGFEKESQPFDASTKKITVVMKECSLSKDKSVYIAYGKMKQGDVASSISTVKGSELQKNTGILLEDGLVGRLNGFLVFPSSYEPGTTDGDMYVRGLKTTATNNAPLILVDNVESSFSQLNAEEVEEVSVLKDAGALAIYGSRGANGVILVTTKRGKANKREFTINSQTGIHQFLGRKSYLNSYDFAKLYNTAWELDGNSTAFYSDDDIEGYRKTVEGDADANAYLYPNNDYQKMFLEDYSYQQKHNITMSGGNNSARYFAMVGYLRQDGLFKYANENDDYGTNTSYQRINFRSNVDINVNRLLSVFVDMAGRIELRHYPGSSAASIFEAVTSTPANAYPIFNPDGSVGGTSTYQNNPYGLIALSGYTDTNRRSFDAATGFNIDFGDWVKGLTFTARAGFNFYNLKNRGLTQTFAVYQWNSTADTYTQYGTDSYESFGAVDTGSGFYSQYFGHSQFDYKRSFNNIHNLSAVALFDFSNRAMPGNVPDFKNVDFAVRALYNYKLKYFAELTTSTTACEAFKDGNRFGFFPALAAGWVITEEDFAKGITALNYLKLRASAGKLGLDRPYGTDSDYRFLYLDNWSDDLSDYSFGNPSTSYNGAGEEVAANPDIKWEDAYMYNVGFDSYLLDKKVYLSAEYYYQKRSGIWVKRTGWVPSTYGATVPYENAGSAESRGLEMSLGLMGRSSDFSYNIMAMANYMTSKVIDLQEAPQTYDYQYDAGKLINETWVLNSNGFYTDDEDVANSATSSYGDVEPGDIKYVDTNEDGTIDSDDEVGSGKSEMPHWQFSLNTDLTYKNFDFSMLWQGMAGRYVVVPSDYVLPFYSGNAMTSALDAWTPDNTDAKYPRLTVSNFENNAQTSDFWLKDASYLRLKTLEIGYSLPKNFLIRAGIAQARVFFNGHNLITFTGLDFDPEYISAGIEQYPASRVYTVGLNLSF